MRRERGTWRIGADPAAGSPFFLTAATLPGVLPGHTFTDARDQEPQGRAVDDGRQPDRARLCGRVRDLPVIGDVLILVAERVPDGTTLLHGQGYLVPDYPQTAEVLATRTPRTLTLADPDLDPAEASVLRNHGFASLVMAPFLLQGEVWGLVEAYRHDVRPFTEADVRTVVEISTVD